MECYAPNRRLGLSGCRDNSGFSRQAVAAQPRSAQRHPHLSFLPRFSGSSVAKRRNRTTFANHHGWKENFFLTGLPGVAFARMIGSTGNRPPEQWPVTGGQWLARINSNISGHRPRAPGHSRKGNGYGPHTSCIIGPRNQPGSLIGLCIPKKLLSKVRTE